MLCRRIACGLRDIQQSNLQQLSQKKRFVLRIDEETMRALERWAGDEFRSVNGQLEFLLSRALKEAGRSPKPKFPSKLNEDEPD